MKLYETCLRCGRKLKNEESKQLGFGKVCWEKYNSNTQIKLFNTEGINEVKETSSNIVIDNSGADRTKNS